MGDSNDPRADFAVRVVDWQKTHGRNDLPWQKTRDTYRVWLSEVMLQQTQVATVLVYYERFLARFPDVRSLGAAPLGDVLAAWSGLGYYSRARNLHRAAQIVVAEHGGEFPRTSEGLATLPGIGRSTAAAIAAFSFGERAAILDGNVKRVLARFLAFERDLADKRAEELLWREAEALLPERGIESYTQGLMDLGASVCTSRAPLCLLCPVSESCVAAASGTQTHYPARSRRSARARRANVWLELRWRGDVFLVEREQRGIWSGLFSLPELDSMAALDDLTRDWPGEPETSPAFVHVLTHLEWELQPVRWTFPKRTPGGRVATLLSHWPAGGWFAPADALARGLPAPLRKRLEAA